MRLLATVLSFIFHPIFIIIYSFCFYFNIECFYNFLIEESAPNSYWVFLTLLLTMGVFFPLLSMLIMYKSKIITNFSIPIRRQRIPILLLVIVYYSMTYYVFRHWNNNLFHLFEPFLTFLFGGIVSLVIATIVTIKWKISLHALAISGFSGGMLGLLLISGEVYNLQEMMVYNTILLLLMGVVSYSRLVLKTHTYTQVIVGIVLGFSIELSCVLFHISI
tara:strand:+ start:1000 stop:1656 length:657 start_codon:yes stop_codon:yes gene_type:complete